jgi:hypothetical protein
MAISFADKKRRIFAEARKPEAKTQLKNLAKALKNISKFPASERGELKKLVESIYENLVEKPKKGMQGGTKKSSTPTTKLSQILKEFKAKIGNEKWKEATRGTDIYRDMERPALKKGKRIVRKRGKTSNQYGTFKNKVGSVYYENRARHSDVNQPSTKRYPKLADGGEFGGGGKTKSIIERIKKANTISEKDINLLKRRYNANSDDESVKEVLDYYNEVDFPKLDADQTKKGYDFLMNLWKSPTGKVRTNNPFGSREQRILDDFSHFEFGGFYDDGNSYRSNFIPIYIVHSKDGAAFEYIFRGGSLKIIGKDGGQFAKGGSLQGDSLNDLERKLSILEYKRAEWMSVSESRVVKKSPYDDKIDDLEEAIKKLKGKNKTEPTKKGRTGKKQIKRKKVTRQYPNYDKEMDGEWIAKPQGYRFTEKLRKKLGIKNSWAKPTQEQIEKYRGRGVYSENRQDKSDVKPKRTKPSL